MSRLEAVNELVLTTAPGVIITPLGLTNITLPLELSFPEIDEGVEPLTLFNDEELEVGILKSTRPLLLIEKLSQSIIDLLVT